MPASMPQRRAITLTSFARRSAARISRLAASSSSAKGGEAGCGGGDGELEDRRDLRAHGMQQARACCAAPQVPLREMPDSKKTQLAKAQALVRLHSPFRPSHLTRATDLRSSCAQNPAVKAPHGRWANVADCLPKSQRQPLAPASAGQVQALAETEAPRSPLMQRVMGTAQRVVAFRFSRSPSK